MPRTARPVHERFWEKVEKTDGCWLWLAAQYPAGYGHFWVNDRGVRAHRWAYENEHGPIAEGLTIDHLCRVKHCVRPDHLEAVTLRENILRSDGVTARFARATHCQRGHAFDEANTHRTPEGHRSCRACKQENNRKWTKARRRGGQGS